MNNKAFTLIELLGVLMIIAIIATVVTVTVDRSIKNSRVKTCEAQEKNIVEAAKTFLTDKQNKSYFPTDGSYSQISISTLKNNGYMDSDLKNPMTQNSYDSNDKVIVISCGKKAYIYKVCYYSQDQSCNGTQEETCNYIINNRTTICNNS